VAFRGQSSRFLKPVHLGDTLYLMLTITAVEPGRTTGVLVTGVTVHNQEGQPVMEGEHRYPERRKP
jgi:acyl dehydratase